MIDALARININANSIRMLALFLVALLFEIEARNPSLEQLFNAASDSVQDVLFNILFHHH